MHRPAIAPPRQLLPSLSPHSHPTLTSRCQCTGCSDRRSHVSSRQLFFPSPFFFSFPFHPDRTHTSASPRPLASLSPPACQRAVPALALLPPPSRPGRAPTRAKTRRNARSRPASQPSPACSLSPASRPAPARARAVSPASSPALAPALYMVLYTTC